MPATEFLETMPDVEIKDGVLFITVCETGVRTAIPLSIARMLVRIAGTALAAFDAKPSNIAPACRMCPGGH